MLQPNKNKKNKYADGGYMNNGIHPKFNDYLNNGQHAFGGNINLGDPPKFVVTGDNPMIVPSQGSYPLSYRDRGDRDADGVLFTQAKKVSRVDESGKPMTRNQIAENQLMWNMQKEAYGPAQQAFNVWKNNEENTLQGGYNPQEYYDMVAKLNSRPDVQLDNLNIKENYKRGETKGSCSTGQANRGESLRDNRAYGGWLDKYDDSKQYAEGGEIDPPVKNKPIYVESKNDPRYKAYQDSLYYHNATKDLYTSIKNANGKNLTPKQREELFQKYRDSDSKIYTKDISNDRWVYDKDGMATDHIIGKDIQPIRRGSLDLKGDFRYGAVGEIPFSYYKEPEQQIIVKEQEKRQPIKAIQNNLRPEGLVYGNTDLNSTLPTIRPVARNAKSYKVKETVQGKYAPSTVDYEVTDPRNINMNDLGPDNTRTVIPQYKYGGQIDPPGKKKFQFLQPTSDKLPEGYRIPYNTPSSERAMSIGGEDGEPAYLIPSFKYGKSLDDPMGEFKKTGEHLGGPFKTWQEADEWERTVRHPAVEKKQTIMFPQEKFQMGGHLNQKQSNTNSWLNKYEQ